ARSGVDAARRGDREAAGIAFDAAAQRFAKARDHLDSWSTFPARQLPLVGPQLRALKTVAALGARTAPTARESVETVDPDKLRFVGGRPDLAVLASYQPVFDDLARQTRAVRADLGAIPREWLVAPLDHFLGKFQTTLARADDSARTADQA